MNVKKMEPRAILQKCVVFAKEKKATGLVSMELTKVSGICDYFLLCTTSNVKQAQSVCDNIEEKMQELGEPAARIEGYRQGRWILLDLGPVIVHIFQQEEREYYNLERLWGDAPLEEY